MILEFVHEKFHVKAKIGHFLKTSFVEEIEVYKNEKDVTKKIKFETLTTLVDIALVKYKELI